MKEKEKKNSLWMMEKETRYTVRVVFAVATPWATAVTNDRVLPVLISLLRRELSDIGIWIVSQ